jgi:hypothetical protein
LKENNGMITGFEFKWKAKKQTKLPVTFIKNYGANAKIIDTGLNGGCPFL